MKNKDQILIRINKLIEQGEKFSAGDFLLDFPNGERSVAAQTWLGQSVIVINVALPASHPFRKQAAAYFAGGGLLGVQGMLALLKGLALEIEAGTFD